jgi:peptidoglycan-associated lipoprotein
MNSCALRIAVVVTLASGWILAGSRPALVPSPSWAAPGVASPRPSRVRAQVPRAPGALAQAPSAPPAAAPAPDPQQPIGLPRVRDYEPIPELRDIYFDFGQATIRPEDVKILNASAAWLRANPGYLLLIEGHSDSRGAMTAKNEFNMDLGERRARAAMSHLIEQGVQPTRITILSYGEERPQCSEQSEQCWRQNRRSRFLVKPH